MVDITPVRKIARYGYRPSLRRHDEPIFNTTGLKVLAEVDPRDVFKKIIFNQWALGSCTANATGNVFRYDSILDGHDPGRLSRFQIYWGERKIEGTLGQGDTGAEGHDAFTVAKAGVALDTDWPYDWKGMTDEDAPANSVFDPATLPEKIVEAPIAYKLTKPVATVPQNETAIKQALSNQQTIAIGFTVYESFESPEVAQTGIMPIPERGEEILGGHETVVLGYLKSEPHYALVANSWGGEDTEDPLDQGTWGLDGEGFFLMPWSYLTNPNLVTDIRTIDRTAS